ncbi:MAG: hypothetical protein AAF629_11595 [Chloroflexota bacterium]
MKYYTFQFGDSNAGWFEIEQTDTQIYMNAIFKMDNQEFENPYWVKLENGKPTEYKSASSNWKKMPTGSNIYPESAYPILVPQVKNQLAYIALHEDTGEISGETALIRQGNEIKERRDGEIRRKFWLEDGEVVKIDWGGAISERRPSLAEAKLGSDF